MPKIQTDFEECHKIFNEDNEGFDRNFVLHYYHGKIPSYACWDGHYIHQTSNKCRLKWWKNYENVPEENISKLAKTWINYLSSQLSD